MPQILKISKENATFQIISALKTNREKRNKLGFFFEGVRNINNALKFKWNITAFIYSTDNGLSDWAKDIIKSSKAETHYDLSPKLLKEISNKEEPSELMAIASIPKDDLNKIPTKDNPLIVVFDSPSSPGNLGTLIRSCDAMGVDGLIITGYAVDVYDPETISATTGSLFSLPIVRLPSSNDLSPWLEGLRKKYPELQVIGTDEKGTKTIYENDFKKPTILLAGNEKRGLSAAYREMVSAMVKIPMQGSASSLNVAVATSIILSEAKRQRSI
jgi:TrmH family RNA methyltransferase